jgi:hypothetical protein
MPSKVRKYDMGGGRGRGGGTMNGVEEEPCPYCGDMTDHVFECRCGNEGCDACLFPAGNGTLCIECEEGADETD